jgi:hypothetical protein
VQTLRAHRVGAPALVDGTLASMSEERRVHRLTAWVGAGLGLAVALPLVCFAFLLLAKAGVVATQPGVRVARFALVFAGLPTLLAGSGAARLAAYRALEVPGYRVVRTVFAHATPAMAIAGAGLMILVGVPLGGMPEQSWRWSLLALAGALAGIPAGLVIAWWVARRSLY